MIERSRIRWCAALLAASLALHPVLAQVTKILGTSVPGTSCTNIGIQFWWRLEGATLTTGDYSAGDTTANLTGGGIAINATQAKMGTNGLKVPGTTSNWAEFVVSGNDIANAPAGHLSMWFRYASGAWSDSKRLFTLYGDSSDQIRVAALPTEGYLRLTHRGQGNNINVETTSAVLAADTWHFVEVVWNASLGTDADILSLYVDHTLVANATGSDRNLTTWALASPTFLYLGDYTGGNQWAGDTYYDQIIISNDTDKDLWSCRDTTAYP